MLEKQQKNKFRLSERVTFIEASHNLSATYPAKDLLYWSCTSWCCYTSTQVKKKTTSM